MQHNLQQFYEEQKNFSDRRLSEYEISPGIRCKFDLLKNQLDEYEDFINGIDLGCSGNSFLYFFEKVKKKFFLDLVNKPLTQYVLNPWFHPICGDIIRLPFKDESFEFISALDVLEHVKRDEEAISEISRIMKKKGIVVITVPHRMHYFTAQDKLIGHFRRYEIDQIVRMFEKFNLINIKLFGVYGKLMKIADVQAKKPEKIQRNLMTLREKYDRNISFRVLWKIFVKISASIMKIDAKHQLQKNIMNIAFIFKKT